MRKYYLYALFDPNLKIPKYTGISNNLERRFKEHLEEQYYRGIYGKKFKPVR